MSHNMGNTQTLYTQLLAAQSEFPKIKKDAANPFFKNKYASLDGILEEVLPILHKHGLFIVQSPINIGDRVGIQTDVYHTSGDSISSSFTMVLAKNDPQGAGSAISYARRYSLVSMLGLNLDDDDANTASGNVQQRAPQPTTTQPQATVSQLTNLTGAGQAGPIRR